jgi:hypothetical protein
MIKSWKLWKESQDLVFDIDDFYWSRANVSLSISGGENVTGDLDKIEKMISDYKTTYIKNRECIGSPPNREWVDMYSHEFRLGGSTIYSKPLVLLTIHIKDFGYIVLGFSIWSKKISSMDVSRIGKEIDCPRCGGTGINWGRCTKTGCRGGRIINPEWSGEIKKISEFITTEIWDKKLTYDEVIDNFNIEVVGDFNFTPISDDINRERIKKYFGDN